MVMGLEFTHTCIHKHTHMRTHTHTLLYTHAHTQTSECTRSCARPQAFRHAYKLHAPDWVYWEPLLLLIDEVYRAQHGQMLASAQAASKDKLKASGVVRGSLQGQGKWMGRCGLCLR